MNLFFHGYIFIQMFTVFKDNNLSFRVICNILTSIWTICCVNAYWKIVSKYWTRKSDCPLWWIKSDNINCSVGVYWKGNKGFCKSCSLLIVFIIIPCYPFIWWFFKMKSWVIAKLFDSLSPHFREGIWLLRTWSLLFDSHR